MSPQQRLIELFQEPSPFHLVLTQFQSIDWHPINPCGGNFQQCLTDAREAGHQDVIAELQQMQDSHQYRVEYALAHSGTIGVPLTPGVPYRRLRREQMLIMGVRRIISRFGTPTPGCFRVNSV
ncbi:hypothetical protein Hjap01_04136 [Haloarcula japonica]